MIKIAYLYRDLLNLYGESGNIIAMERALKVLNVDYSVDELSIGDNIVLSNYDFVYIGSGTEENIKIVSEDIIKYKDSIKKYIDDEKVMLVTGNSIVLFANSLKDENDSTIFNGLGIINSDARVSSKRIVCESLFKSEGLRDDIIGFQNRGFYLDKLMDNDKLFDVVSGVGVNKNLNIEGMNKNNFYATFLIGPILVRNPEMLNCFVNLILKDEKFVKLDFAKEAYEKFKALYYGKN